MNYLLNFKNGAHNYNRTQHRFLRNPPIRNLRRGEKTGLNLCKTKKQCKNSKIWPDSESKTRRSVAPEPGCPNAGLILPLRLACCAPSGVFRSAKKGFSTVSLAGLRVSCRVLVAQKMSIHIITGV